MQSIHVSYAGDCLIAPANMYAVAPSHARDRWELRDPCLANDRNLNGRKLMLSICPPFLRKNRAVIVSFSPPHVWKEKRLKTQRCSASHAPDRWEFRNPCRRLALDRSEAERKNVRSGSVRLLSRRSNVRNVNSRKICFRVVYYDMVSFCLFVFRSCDRTCGKHLLHSSICTVAPRMRVTGESFAIGVSFSIKPKRKKEGKNARTQSARLLCERIATVRVFRFFFPFFFFFFWRPSRKLVVANAKS